MLFIGVDLAWGEKKADGICFIEARRVKSTTKARILSYAYPRGDEELMALLGPHLENPEGVFITIDAPIVCPNVSGTRPVDRLTHRMFHREHAACHPANLTKCPRPPRVLARLRALGARAGWEVGAGLKTVAEVYPHPAMVRLFRLPRIVKYKKGRVREKRKEFKRLQRLMRRCMEENFPFLAIDRETDELLGTVWSKTVEDKTDALFCSLIGVWHWCHGGKRTEVIGDAATGFILLPAEMRTPRERSQA